MGVLRDKYFIANTFIASEELSECGNPDPGKGEYNVSKVVTHRLVRKVSITLLQALNSDNSI